MAVISVEYYQVQRSKLIGGVIDISQVKVGEYLLTFDKGMRPVTDISVSSVWASEGVCTNNHWPFYVPEMVLGNTCPIIIMPEHQVLFNSEILKKETGNAYALVPITALEGFCGIRKIVPMERLLSFDVKFARNELLILNGGAILNCKADVDFLAEIMCPSIGFRLLGYADTKALIKKIQESIILEDQPIIQEVA